MRKLIIGVILLITLALGIFLYLNEPKNTELNSIKPLKYTKQQTELLETLNLKDKVKVFKFNYDKNVEVVNVSVSLYCKGSLVHENTGLTYIYDDNITDVNNQLKNGEIVLNYSTDSWVIYVNENGSRMIQNIPFNKIKNYITNFKVAGEATYYQNQQVKISKDKPVVLHMTVYMKNGKGYSNNIIEQCSQDLSYLKELDWAIVTKVRVK